MVVERRTDLAAVGPDPPDRVGLLLAPRHLSAIAVQAICVFRHPSRIVSRHRVASGVHAVTLLPADDNERDLREATSALHAAVEHLRAAGEKAPATPLLGPLPPPDIGDFKKESSPASDLDIGGIWQQDHEPDARYQFPPVEMFIVAFRNQLVGANLERVPYLGPGTAFLTGTYASRDSVKADVREFNDSEWSVGTRSI